MTFGAGAWARFFVALTGATVVATAARAEGLDFDRVFATRGEPLRLFYAATFVSRGAPHHLEVWRDGDRRIKRVADHAVSTYAWRRSGAPDFHLAVADDRRKIITLIDRTNLYRLGNFADWFDLGHALRHPKGRYRLSAAPPPKGAAPTTGACEWFALAEPTRVSRICWDAHDRLPLLILSPEGVVQWRVTRVSTARFTDAIFQVPAKGYIRNDANRDIERD